MWSSALRRPGRTGPTCINRTAIKARFLVTVLSVAGLALNCAGPASAEQHELGLTLGCFAGLSRDTGDAKVDLQSGIALRAKYGYGLTGSRAVALFGEIHLLANAALHP